MDQDTVEVHKLAEKEWGQYLAILMDQDTVEVHKLAAKEWGQYLAILTSHMITECQTTVSPNGVLVSLNVIILIVWANAMEHCYSNHAYGRGHV